VERRTRSSLAQRDSHHVEPAVTFLSGMISASREPCLLNQNWTAYTWHSSLHYFFLHSIPLCCTSYGNSVRPSVRPSVSPSVCLSHADIVSKRLHTARCSLHCQIAKCVCFLETKKIFPRDDPFLLKSWFKLTYPVLIAASLDTFCLVESQR